MTNATRRYLRELLYPLLGAALIVSAIMTVARRLYLEFPFPVLQPASQVVTATVGLFLLLLTGGVVAAIIASLFAKNRVNLKGKVPALAALIGNGCACLPGAAVLSYVLWDPWAWLIVLSLTFSLGWGSFTIVLTILGRRSQRGARAETSI